MNKFWNFNSAALSKQRLKIVVSVLLAFLWTSFTSIYLSNQWGWSVENTSHPAMGLAQLISVPLLSFILFFLMRSVYLARRSPALFSLGLVYFIVTLALFFSVAPGCFTEDTFYTFHMVKNGWWEGWYSSMHPLFMTGFIQIIPWQFNAPGIFLTMLWSAVYVFIHFILLRKSAPRWMHFLVPLMLIWPAQLVASLIIVRDGYFTAIFIFYILYIFYLISIKKIIEVSDIFALSAVGFLLSFYRSDALPGVLIGIVFAAIIWAKRSPYAVNKLSLVTAIAFPFLFFYILSLLPSMLLEGAWEKGNTWGKRAEMEYKITLIENPLGYIVRNGGIVSADHRENIEKVFKIEDLKNHWCPGNLCLFYGGHWNQQSSKQEREDAFKSSMIVFFQNPRLFLLSRLETLKTVGERSTQTRCSADSMKERGYPRVFESNKLWMIGDNALKFIRDTETVEGVMGGKSVWWNVYVRATLLFALLAFFRKAPASSIASLVLLGRSIVVFFAAPAGFTVYYTALFIGAPIIFLLFILEIITIGRGQHLK